MTDQINQEEINGILYALAKLPYEHSAELIHKIQKQLEQYTPETKPTKNK